MLALYRVGPAGRGPAGLPARPRRCSARSSGLDPGPELQALEAAILGQDPSLLLPPRPPRRSARPSDQHHGGPQPLHRAGGRPRGPRSPRGGPPAGDDRRAGGRREDAAWRRSWPGASSSTTRSSSSSPRWATRPRSPTRWRSASGSGRPGPLQGDASAGLDRLVEHLADRPTIVVMDNCEHVIGESARVVEQLLVRCPLLRVLATSREALGLGGETIWPVPPLAIEDAVDLFTDRAGAAGAADGSLDATSVVEDVCTRLDGLPLAIELAAARVRVIPVQQLADRLDDRFRLLTGGARTAMPRQQTLRAVVEWSYDLLFDDERHVFELLSVFAGGCSLEAAEAVCAGDQIETEEVADLLAHLVDKSLVVADHVDGEARFHLLQTLALFGRERLAASKAANDARDRHAAHYLALAERGPAAFRGDDQVAWLAEIARESDNLRVGARVVHRPAGRGGRAPPRRRDGLDVVDGRERGGGVALVRLRPVLRRGRWIPGPGPTCSPGPVGSAPTAAKGWSSRSAGARRRSPCCGTSTRDDRLSLADACQLLAIAHMRPAQHERALELFDEAVALNAGRDDGWSRAVGASAAGLAAGIRGDLQAALEHHLASMEHFEAIGAEWAVANVGSDIAQVVEARGDLDAAVAFTERAMLAARRLNLQLAEIQLGARLGNLLLCQGDVEGADALHEEAMALAESVGSRVSYGVIFTGRAMVRWAQGRLQEAADAAADALAVYRRTQLVVRPGAVARPARLRDGAPGRQRTRRGAPHRGARRVPPARRRAARRPGPGGPGRRRRGARRPRARRRCSWAWPATCAT